jgi:cellulose synthase/poly-beta-1,6-N-acetylglucosamine synthase-like glycosyltransferase
VTELAFWAAALVVGYTYVGFPLLLLVRAVVAPRRVADGDVEPVVSVVLAARNEAAAIGERIDNLLSADYPAGSLEVVVASDGSTDGTVDVARGRADARVRVLDLPRVGKAAALDAAVAAATGDVILFTDANTRFDRDAIRRLVRPFADPEVGGVAGDQRYLQPDAGADVVGERRYWDLDRLLKVAESRAGSVVSATGAIYALRRELVGPVLPGVTDDFYNSTAAVAAGRRLVFAEDAVAREPVAPTMDREFERKVRIMTRGLRGVAARRSLLDPRRFGFYAVQLLTHKVLRRLAAIPLLVMAVTAPLLAPSGWFYRLATTAELGLVALGLAGIAGRGRSWTRHPLVALPAFFLLVNVASLRALANLVSGSRIDRWEPRREPGEAGQ